MDKQSALMERACTLGMATLFALAMVYFGWSSTFGHGGFSGPLAVIAPWIHPLVLASGVALLILLGFQFYGLWKGDASHHDLVHHHGHGPEGHAQHEHQHHHEDGKPCAHDHKGQHVHGPGCSHEPGHDHLHHPGHAHNHEGVDHTHEHGWSPIRYIPLVIPLLLCAMGLPNVDMIRAYEQDIINQSTGGDVTMTASPAPGDPLRQTWSLGILTPQSDGAGLALAVGAVVDMLDEDPNAPVDRTNLAELDRIVANPVLRQQWSLKRNVEVQGMFNPGQTDGSGLHFFSVVQIRVACCLGDARPALMFCAAKKPPDVTVRDWVAVRGRLDFIQTSEGLKPAMRVFKVEKRQPPARTYLTK